MPNSVTVAPPHSMIFVSDRDIGMVPEITRGGSVWATSSCIAIGCLSFMDGYTEIIMGDLNEVDPGERPALDRQLDTPFRTVIISTSERETLLTRAVENVSTHVRVWTNHASEPDKVIIGVK